MYRVLARVALTYPRTITTFAILLSLLSILSTIAKLEFKTSRLDLVSSREKSHQLFRQYRQEFGEPSRIAVVIQGNDRKRAEAFATDLGNRLAAQGEQIEEVFYRIDLEPFKQKALFYLSKEELLDLRRKLEEHQELLRALAASPGLNSFFELINREITSGLVGHLFTGFLLEEEKRPVDLSLLISLLRQLNDRVEGAADFPSPWETMLTGEKWKPSKDGYLWSDDDRFLFVLVNPKATPGSFERFKGAVESVRASIAQLRKGYPDLEVGVTGVAVLESDEMRVAQRDMTIATLISLIGVAVLYFALFKGVIRPLLALGTLVIGVCWALGFATFTLGHLNIITVAFAPMLIGLGIDYGSYLIARYEEERAAGKGVQEALVQTFIATGPGILTTALTTTLTFGALLFSGFKGLVELGLISGGGILLILLATLTVLPSLLVLQERGGERCVVGRRAEAFHGGYLEGLYRFPWVTLFASGVLVTLSFLALKRVEADFNLLHLQAEGTESVVWERKLLENAKRSAWFGVVLADRLEEAREKEKALEALPSVAKVESITSLIPGDQERKVRLIKGLRPFLHDVSLRRDGAEPVDLEALLSTLGRIRFKMLEEGEAAWDPEKKPPLKEMREVRALIDRFIEKVKEKKQEEVYQALTAYQEELVRDLGDKLDLLRLNLEAKPMTLTDLPRALRERFVGRNGRYRLLVFPAEDIWEPGPLQRFVQEIRTVDPNALGDPVLGFEHMRAMKEGYEKAGLYALLGVSLLAFLRFREWRSFLLALIPLAGGSLWTLGFMGLFQVRFNLANLIVLPLITAPALESGIMIVYRFQEERGRSKAPAPLPKSTGRAVTFSALSTMVGFGSLMISRHRGILSIGLLLTFGVGCVLLASLTVLPALLQVTSFARRGEA